MGLFACKARPFPLWPFAQSIIATRLRTLAIKGYCFDSSAGELRKNPAPNPLQFFSLPLIPL